MAMPFMQEGGDLWSIAFALNNYGEVARSLGDYEEAEKFYRRTEELFEEVDARGDQARLVHTFGYIAQHKGDFDKAKALFQESLQDFRKLGNYRGIAECLAGLAGLEAELGNHRWAAPLLGAAEGQLRSFSGAWWPADRVEIEKARERMKDALKDDFEAFIEQGQAMSVEEAIAYASTGS
jgi:tetratricopeptide (TPR) repeat protein